MNMTTTASIETRGNRLCEVYPRKVRRLCQGLRIPCSHASVSSVQRARCSQNTTADALLEQYILLGDDGSIGGMGLRRDKVEKVGIAVALVNDVWTIYNIHGNIRTSDQPPLGTCTCQDNRASAEGRN